MIDIEQVRISMKAQSLVGTKFKHLGRDELGLDCAGLIVVCLRNSGFKIEDNLTYSNTDPDYKILTKKIDQYCKKINPADAKEGDIILLFSEGNPKHVGIYSEEKIIHASKKHGSVVETRFKNALNSDICAVYRLKRFCDE